MSKTSITKAMNPPFPKAPKGLLAEQTLALLRGATCLQEGADPTLFESVTPPGSHLALSYCGRCPVIDLCEATVRPGRSAFDGVCAGRVWVNGNVIPS